MTKKADLHYKNRPVSYWLTPMSQEQLARLRAGADADAESDQPLHRGRWPAYKWVAALAVAASVLLAVAIFRDSRVPSASALQPLFVEELRTPGTLAPAPSGARVRVLTTGRKYRGHSPGHYPRQPLLFHLTDEGIQHVPMEPDGSFPVSSDDGPGCSHFVEILPHNVDPRAASPEFWFSSAAKDDILRTLQEIGTTDDDNSTAATTFLLQTIRDAGREFDDITVMRIEYRIR